MKTGEELLNLLNIVKEKIPVGSFWKHHKGNIYKVIEIALNESDLAPMVIYSNEEGLVWVRKVDIFLEEIKINDKVTQRFTQI